MFKNNFFTPLLLLLTTTCMLVLYSVFFKEYELMGITLKKVDFFSEIKRKPQSFIIAAQKDTAQTDSSKTLVDGQLKEPFLVDYSSDTATGLTRFFEHLRRYKKEVNKIRVAYFGDSMIEGDLLTMDLRSLFQKKYGGEGVGMVPITCNTAGFRMTIKQTFSNDFTNYSLLDTSSSSRNLGITGFTSVPQINDSLASTGTSWVSFTAPSLARLDKFKKVKLFYGPSKGSNYVAIDIGTAPKKLALNGQKLVNELEINAVNTKKVSANFQCDQLVNLYGMSFESDSGFYIDNYAVRGNAGLALTKIPQQVLSNFNSYLNYDLIVLHYGLNATNPNVKDYSWYERGLENMVNHMKRAFPKASFLLVSVNDKSYKENGEYVTDPSVLLIVDAQKRVAKKTKIAFFNLYEAMGGYNSMVKWATADTVLANKDFTHLNRRGAAKVAGFIYKELNAGFEQYKKKPNS